MCLNKFWFDCIYLINEVNQLTLYILFWFLYPIFKKMYKCNENIGIGTQHRQVSKINYRIGRVLEKVVSVHP